GFWRPFSLWSSVALALVLVVLVCLPKRDGSDSDLIGIMWTLYAYFSIYIAKYLFVIVDLIGKLPCLFGRGRIRACGLCGIVVATAAFALMWWGALVNRFNIDVRRVDVDVPGLPASMDGFTVAQISDLHVGTYGTDTAFVAKLVRRVNALHPDLIVFTGDIVNRRSTELEPFVATLGRLSAPEGVLSVLGNHDYGDYYDWPSAAARQADRRHLHELEKSMGWNLLNNATAAITRPDGTLAVIGVENIGDPPFPVYGDLDNAYPGDLADSVPKILLSHNPAHWDADIKDSPDKNIALTLSGHTHAMQISAGGLSPAVFRYPLWGGMYTDQDGHSLYVNIGVGEVGIPARIGATPEITLFTLRP
ncbi:MAG: metallophosphoesterase, partial [Muribaculaceae bacterium]|nr:metallophosphoesterase [Muribaculaceae bacterium]